MKDVLGGRETSGMLKQIKLVRALLDFLIYSTCFSIIMSHERVDLDAYFR